MPRRASIDRLVHSHSGARPDRRPDRIVIALLLALSLTACGPTEPPPAGVALQPARLLDFWQPVSDTLPDPTTAHDWRFVAAQGDAIHIALRDQGRDVALSLTDPDGAVIATGSDIRQTLATGGIYTITVRLTQGNPSGYTLALEYTDRPDPSQPTPTATFTTTPSVTPSVTPSLTPTPPFADLGDFRGMLADGSAHSDIIEGDQRHVLIFRGEAGQFVNVRVARISGGFDPAVTLHDPDGSPLALDDDSGGADDALLTNIRLPVSGDYSLQTRGDGGAGEYRLLLTIGGERAPVTPLIPPPTPTVTPSPTPAPRTDRLVDHVPVPGRVARPGDFARFPIVAVAGETFTVGVSPVAGSGLRPVIELYDPSGALVSEATVGTSNAGGDALIPAVQAAESGTYIALVLGEGNTTGEYIMTYGLGNSRENVVRGEARVDVENRGQVARRGLRDVWTINLNAGDEITATVRPLDTTFDPALDLLAPDGTVIAFSDNTGGGVLPVISRARAPISGPYALRVTGANAASSGAYALVWRYVIAAPTPTPPATSVRLLSADDIMPAQTYQSYPFQALAGQVLLIRTETGADSDLDLVAALLDPTGNIIVEADDSDTGLNPQFFFEVPADGTYTLRLNGYGTTSGAYQVFVEALF